MFTNSIHISLYDISLTQNILYQIKRDVAVRKILGCPQRNQRTWWQIVATPYTGAASIMRPLSRGLPRDNSAVHGASEDVPGMTYDVPGVSYPIPWTSGDCPPGRAPSGRPRDTQFGIDWSLLPSGCPQGVRTAEVQPITARTHYGQEVGLPTVRPKSEVDVP